MTLMQTLNAVAAKLNALAPETKAFNEGTGGAIFCVFAQMPDGYYVIGDANETWGADVYASAEAYGEQGEQPARYADTGIATNSEDATAIVIALLAPLLARKFSAVLLEWLGDARLREVIAKNATPEYKGCCATGDYCDSNMAMVEAFEHLRLLTPEDPHEERFALWNAAWDMAKANGFYLDVAPALPPLPEGTIARLYRDTFGEDLKRDFTTLPIDSECGRDCEKLILAGAAMLESIRNTYPDHEAQPHIAAVKTIVVDGCEVYYFG